MANIPFIFAWSALGFADSLSAIYVAFIVMGFGLGLKEASSLTYASEISETSIRGMLLASAGVFGSFGLFALFFLGAFLSWRTVALICVIVPICTLITMLFVSFTSFCRTKYFRMKIYTLVLLIRCQRRQFGCFQPSTVKITRKKMPKQ